MSDRDCPNCHRPGRLATDYSLDWYRCPECHETYEVTHTLCSYPSCASWADDEESGLCWYHAAHVGIHPEKDDDDE
jgi:hypothetical protein